MVQLEPVLHPRLVELLVLSILLTAAKPCLPLVFTALRGVVGQGSLPVGVRQGVRWLWSPAHHLVLHGELDPLSRSEGTDGPETVLLLVAVTHGHLGLD